MPIIREVFTNCAIMQITSRGEVKNTHGLARTLHKAPAAVENPFAAGDELLRARTAGKRDERGGFLSGGEIVHRGIALSELFGHDIGAVGGYKPVHRPPSRLAHADAQR